MELRKVRIREEEEENEIWGEMVVKPIKQKIEMNNKGRDGEMKNMREEVKLDIETKQNNINNHIISPNNKRRRRRRKKKQEDEMKNDDCVIVSVKL